MATKLKQNLFLGKKVILFFFCLLIGTFQTLSEMCRDNYFLRKKQEKNPVFVMLFLKNIMGDVSGESVSLHHGQSFTVHLLISHTHEEVLSLSFCTMNGLNFSTWQYGELFQNTLNFYCYIFFFTHLHISTKNSCLIYKTQRTRQKKTHKAYP